MQSLRNDNSCQLFYCSWRLCCFFNDICLLQKMKVLEHVQVCFSLTVQTKPWQYCLQWVCFILVPFLWSITDFEMNFRLTFVFLNISSCFHKFQTLMKNDVPKCFQETVLRWKVFSCSFEKLQSLLWVTSGERLILANSRHLFNPWWVGASWLSVVSPWRHHIKSQKFVTPFYHPLERTGVDQYHVSGGFVRRSCLFL